MSHTGETFGKKIIDGHTCVVCETSFIGSYVVDGGVNVGKYIEVIWLSTSDDRYGMIFFEKCDARQMNMTGKMASGTTLYKVNLNPELGKYLFLIHTYLVRLGGSGTRMKVYANVIKERHQKRSPDLTTDVRTIWNQII